MLPFIYLLTYFWGGGDAHVEVKGQVGGVILSYPVSSRVQTQLIRPGGKLLS